MIKYRIKNRKGVQVAEYELDDSMSPALLNGFTAEVLGVNGKPEADAAPAAVSGQPAPVAAPATPAPAPAPALTPPQIVAAPAQVASATAPVPTP